MNRSLAILVACLLLTVFVSGCGGDTGKDINSGKDKPLPAGKPG
jgi:hypothetical protein